MYAWFTACTQYYTTKLKLTTTLQRNKLKLRVFPPIHPNYVKLEVWSWLQIVLVLGFQ